MNHTGCKIEAVTKFDGNGLNQKTQGLLDFCDIMRTVSLKVKITLLKRYSSGTSSNPSQWLVKRYVLQNHFYAFIE